MRSQLLISLLMKRFNPCFAGESKIMPAGVLRCLFKTQAVMLRPIGLRHYGLRSLSWGLKRGGAHQACSARDTKVSQAVTLCNEFFSDFKL